MKASRRSVFAVSSLFLAVSAIGYGCSGDDTVVETPSDSGAPIDGTTLGDSAPPGDAATHDGATADGSTTDAGADAGGPHVVFVTSIGFTGDFISQAAAIESDGGLDAGLSNDGGEDYLRAGDILCTHVAHAAGLSGTFTAIVTAGSDGVLTRFTDPDGPWARVDGTPVADSIANLAAGKWAATIDVDEKGNALAFGGAWGRGTTSVDCNGWTSSNSVDTGGAGQPIYTSAFALGNGNFQCDQHEPLYCAQVGPGAVPNRVTPIPAGGKTVFATDLLLPPNFALPDAGVLDGSAPSGDQVHGVADDVCNQVAKGAGRSGTYRAWVSSSATNAKSYFMSLSMNGPWYRPDGAEVASSLTDLLDNGAATQIEIGANGVILSDPSIHIWTGTKSDGTLVTNCTDFSVVNATESTGGRASNKSTTFTNGNLLTCNGLGLAGLYCFEQ